MSATDANAPGDTPLSIDQAVELMTAPRGEHSDELGVADSDLAEPTEDGGDDEAEPLDPPHFWSAEDKAAFANLPPEMQATVLAYERGRDNASARTIQEAAEARNRAEAAASEAGQMAERLDALAAEAEAAFAQKWPGPVDWAALADEAGVEQAMRLKLQYDQDLEQMQRLDAAKQEAAEVNFRSFVAREFETLKQVAPDLADPKQGGERRQDVVKFLAESGVPLDQIRHAGALEFALAYDAMRYRRATSAYAQGGKSQGPARAGLLPGAASARGVSQQRQAGAKARFASKPTVDNAVAALLARR